MDVRVKMEEMATHSGRPKTLSPYSQIPVIHSRSLSQPIFFSLDSLPPLSPCLPHWSEERRGPRRRSNSVSDIPFGALPPRLHCDGNVEGVGDRKSEGEVTDEFVSAPGSLNQDDLDCRASGTNTSENEAESIHVRTGDDDIAPLPPTTSIIPDFGHESPNAPLATFSFDYGNGEFNAAELKKIMANDKLAETALTDPKRVKRILANRLSAARSKERKVRYISELEHKVQTLQSEATTLSAQLTLLQRDSAALNSQNNELKFRLQAMEQQAHLRDALNEALTAEVKRLKLATGEFSAETQTSSFAKQLSNNSHMFQLGHPRQKHRQLQNLLHPQEQKQQSNSSVTKDESDPLNGLVT